MTDDNSRWQEVDALFEAALDLPPHERRAFLDARCPSPELRARVEALLEAEARSAPFLERRRLVLRALDRALSGDERALSGEERAGDHGAGEDEEEEETGGATR